MLTAFVGQGGSVFFMKTTLFEDTEGNELRAFINTNNKVFICINRKGEDHEHESQFFVLDKVDLSELIEELSLLFNDLDNE